MIALNIIFTLLVLQLLLKKSWREKLKEKKARDWTLDLTGLGIQGLLIPFLQTYVFYSFLNTMAPSYRESLAIHPVLSFSFHFFLVDYLYYWNHRLFHQKRFWAIHKVHHSAQDMDVFVTSRNSVYTSFFLVYLWINTAMIFLLQDPTPYVISVTLTAALDLWKHSKLGIESKTFMDILSKYFFIMTPQDHAWHHGPKPQINYGANLNIYDKLHSTYLKTEHYPQKIGIKTKMTLMEELFNPFKQR